MFNKKTPKLFTFRGFSYTGEGSSIEMSVGLRSPLDRSRHRVKEIDLPDSGNYRKSFPL